MGIPRWLPDDAALGRSGSGGEPAGIEPAGIGLVSASGRDGSRRDVPGWNHDAAASVSHGAAAVAGAADGGGACPSADSGCGPVSQGASG
jgi:hypothetical protein